MLRVLVAKTAIVRRPCCRPFVAPTIRVTRTIAPRRAYHDWPAQNVRMARGYAMCHALLFQTQAVLLLGAGVTLPFVHYSFGLLSVPLVFGFYRLQMGTFNLWDRYALLCQLECETAEEKRLELASKLRETE